MELSGTRIPPFFRPRRVQMRRSPDALQGQNKTGTFGPGMLYVDNRGIVGLAGAGERIGSLQGPRSDNASARADIRAPGQSSVFESGERRWQEA